MISGVAMPAKQRKIAVMGFMAVGKLSLKVSTHAHVHVSHREIIIGDTICGKPVCGLL